MGRVVATGVGSTDGPMVKRAFLDNHDWLIRLDWRAVKESPRKRVRETTAPVFKGWSSFPFTTFRSQKEKAMRPISLFMAQALTISFASVSVQAQDWPQHIGDHYEAIRAPSSGYPWTVFFDIIGTQTHAGNEYYAYQATNWDNAGGVGLRGLLRTTGSQVYGFDLANNIEYVDAQFASVGTKWSHLRPGIPPYNYEVIEIVSIGPLVVPWGTFPNAYKHKKFMCVDPNNLSLGKSPDWNIWIAPGVGFIIQQEDWWTPNPPEYVKLSSMSITPGTSYCFGEPSSGTPCPCGNNNDGTVPGSGCANGVFTSGANLTGSGVASVSADTLLLATTGLEPSNSGLYFQANNDLSPGNIWGDGLQCAGGSLRRLGVRLSDATGYSDTSGFAISISVKAGNILAGDTKYYQCWYRNPLNSPCGSDFNSSNGYAITWLP